MSTTNCFESHVYRRSVECVLLLLLAKVVRFSGTIFHLLLTLFNCYYLFIRKESIPSVEKEVPTSISCSPYLSIVLSHSCTRLVSIHFSWPNLERQARFQFSYSLS